MNALYRMPAEWEEHEGTLISWPVKASMVWEENYEEVCRGYSEVILAIAKFEPVYVLVDDKTQAIAKMYCDSEQVYWLNIAHDDAWIRDNGPTYVWDLRSKTLTGISWLFNAWGEKYPNFELDNAVAQTVNEALGYQGLDVEIVLEGGSIHVDGEGTLLTTKECLLNPNRNPHLNQDDLKNILAKYLGIEHIIWLNQGLYGDETDGHIDNIACFAKEQTILIQTCSNPDDPNYSISKKAMATLNGSVDAKNRPLACIEIEGPPARFYHGKRLTLSYLNYYLVNGGVILPVFGGDAKAYDEKAINTLAQIYPDREIVTIDGMALIKEGGNVHCITQQIPKEVKNNA
ncbi:agmatine deiminase family protein [Vallitaleaceae bacterium 9-2]